MEYSYVKLDAEVMIEPLSRFEVVEMEADESEINQPAKWAELHALLRSFLQVRSIENVFSIS